MQEPDVSVKTYWLAYVALLALMGVNIGVAYLHLGWAGMFIGVTIGAIQAAIIALILMQGLYERPVIHLIMGGALLWFLILVTLTMNDYITRNWVPITGK